MRMSVVKGDPGYGPCYGVTVFLNGIKVPFTRTFDDEVGFVDYMPQPLRLDPEDDGKPYVRRIYGEVTFDASDMPELCRKFYGLS